ncbi:MAG TPA: hypothetical protein VFE46_04705 [Pirellulales bacterium]|nr:hypothetical protein [Pirellulales bacterium]
MLIRSTVLLCSLITGAIVRGDDVDQHPQGTSDLKQLTLAELSPGSHLEFSTPDWVYRGELIDPATGETRLAASRTGTQFSVPQTVFLLGTTQGRAPEAGGQMLVKMNQLQTGLRIELGLGSLEEADRYLTGPVQSLRVEVE